MSIGQFSLRSLAGYLTVVCFCLAILRRPILYFIETIFTFDKWSVVNNEFWMFWYIDFYLLGFEDWWFFELTPFSSGDKLPGTGAIGFTVFLLGMLFYGILHFFALIMVITLFKEIFWPNTEISDEEAEELLSEEEEEDIPVGEEIIEDEEKE